MLTKIKSRYTASAIHFALSCSIFIIFISTLLIFWFPEPFFTASGGWQGLKLVTLVDLVLGPLLTLIVYNPTKTWKVLRVDLAIIALLQLIALVWGIYNVYLQRPIIIAFYDKIFYTVPAKDLEGQNLKKGNFGNQFPAFVYIKIPDSLLGKKEMLRKVHDEKIPPYHQVDLYKSLKLFYPSIKKYSMKVNLIKEQNNQLYQRLLAFLEKEAFNIKDVHVFVLKDKYINLALVFRTDSYFIGAIRLK